MKCKKQIALALLCLGTKGYANDVYSHTYFSPLPQTPLITNLTQNLLVDQAHDEGRVLNKRNVQLAVFGGKSVNTTALRDYFLFDGKQSLLMRENPVQNGGSGNNAIGDTQDLIGSDFNIQTVGGAQSSSITMNPQQTCVGASVSVRVPLNERWWATVEIPVLHVRNDLDLVETFSANGVSQPQVNANGLINPLTGENSPCVATMTQAFKQSGMLYGRIDGIQKVTRIADLTLKVGYDIIDRTDEYMSVYGGLIFPTGNKPQGVYMFEAIAGNGGHAGIQAGLYGQVRLQENPKASVWFGWTFESNYLFTNTQKRSFDLYDRPWSRYLQVFKNESDRITENALQITPKMRTWGVNYFTQDVKVTPGYLGNFNLFASCQGDKWTGTFGMNTTVRQAEKVHLVNQWQQGPEIAALPLYGAGNNFAGATESLRNISVLPNAGDQFGSFSVSITPGNAYVQSSDLDLESAAHPAARSHTLYTNLGYYRKVLHPQYFELSGSYEFATQNVVLNRWMVSMKFQIAF